MGFGESGRCSGGLHRLLKLLLGTVPCVGIAPSVGFPVVFADLPGLASPLFLNFNGRGVTRRRWHCVPCPFGGEGRRRAAARSIPAAAQRGAGRVSGEWDGAERGARPLSPIAV